MPEKKFNSKEEFEKAIIEKCWKSEDFKNDLISNPVSVINSEWGFDLSKLKISIIETQQNEIVIAIPPNPDNAAELNEETLNKISGGADTMDILSWAILCF